MASFRDTNTKTNMLACLSLMVVMVGLMKGATAVEYVVGDSLGWTLHQTPPSIQIGLPPRHFIFNWTGNHNVALPTKEEYDNCSDLQSYLGSPVSVELTAGSNYYFCTVGDHCEQGQKVTITVGSSSPTSAPSGAHATVASLLLGVISSALAISFFTSM
ncbi:hypothetical protein ACLB2K_002730 [Fragaria x ananassa]